MEVNARANQALADSLRNVIDGIASHETRHQLALDTIANGLHDVLMELRLSRGLVR